MKRICIFIMTMIMLTSCSVSDEMHTDVNTSSPSPIYVEESIITPTETVCSGNMYSNIDTTTIFFDSTKVTIPKLPTEELQLSLKNKIEPYIIKYKPKEIDFYCENAFSTTSFTFYSADSTEAYDNNKIYFSYNVDTLKESQFSGFFDKDAYTEVCMKYFSEADPIVEDFVIQQDGITAFYNGKSIHIGSDSFTKDYNLYVFHPEDYSPVTSLEEKYVAITFDDGPNPYTTLPLLDMLEEKGIKATFFLVGYNISAFPSVVQKMYDGGHDIGIHSMRHSNYALMKPEDVIEDIDNCSNLIYRIIKKRPYLVRPPYGNIKIEEIQTNDYFFINWNVDTLDWKSENPEQIAESALKSIHSGSIILLHDIYKSSCDAAEIIIDKLLEEGYRFVTISEFYDLNEKETDNKLHYFSGDYNGWKKEVA